MTLQSSSSSNTSSSSSSSNKYLTLHHLLTNLAKCYSPHVQDALKRHYKDQWQHKLMSLHLHNKMHLDSSLDPNAPQKSDYDKQLDENPALLLEDPLVVLNVIIRLYHELFRSYPEKYFEQRKLSYFHEMRSARHQWAHRLPLSSMELLRHIDTTVRLLEGLPNAKNAYEEVKKRREKLIISIGLFYHEQREKRRSAKQERHQQPASTDVTAAHHHTPQVNHVTQPPPQQQQQHFHYPQQQQQQQQTFHSAPVQSHQQVYHQTREEHRHDPYHSQNSGAPLIRPPYNVAAEHKKRKEAKRRQKQLEEDAMDIG